VVLTGFPYVLDGILKSIIPLDKESANYKRIEC